MGGNSTNIILKTSGISKSFPGVKALDNINFELRQGEVHALVGENGAGKSTFIKILMGVYTADSGEIVLDGEKISITNEQDGLNAGLRAVYQDVNLAQDLTVAENFFLGKLPKKHGMIDWKRVNRIAQESVDAIGVNIDVKKKVRELPLAKQEMVCIAKCVYENAKIIIFDEPTALLTNEETEILFRIINDLKAKGISIIYISHRLEELYRICDRATFLKDGAQVAVKNLDTLPQNDMIHLMVGRELGDLYSIESHKQQQEVLRVEHISREGVFHDISFTLHKGEILGMAGLVGAGRTEVVRSIFGAEQITSGDIYVHGEKVSINKPLKAIKMGIGLLPENRRSQGLAIKLSVGFNINTVYYQNHSRYGLINKKKKKAIPKKYIKDVQVKTPSVDQKVINLSGGNQQKVVISKWLAEQCEILIFDEPTVGIDVGTKQEIYRIMSELTAHGISIIVVSSYLPEVIGLSDQIVVMYEGKMTGTLSKDEASEAILMKYASGMN